MKRSVKRALRVVDYALFAFGAAALAYCAFVYTQAQLTQWYDSWKLDHAPRQAAGTPAPVAEKTPEAAPARVAPGASIGRIEIPRLEVRAMIREGEDNRTLSKAVGHVPGTALPGKAGNAVLAAHRDTFFRGLRHIKKDDVINIKTLEGEHQYRVVETEIVDPTETEVMQPTAEPTLTLITCYPFNFIGHAPKRFIVRAEEVEEATAAAAQTPAPQAVAVRTPIVPRRMAKPTPAKPTPAVRTLRTKPPAPKQHTAKTRGSKAPVQVAGIATTESEEGADSTAARSTPRARSGVRNALSFVPRLGRRIFGR